MQIRSAQGDVLIGGEHGVGQERRLTDEPDPHGLGGPETEEVPEASPEVVEAAVLPARQDTELQEDAQAHAPCDDHYREQQRPSVHAAVPQRSEDEGAKGNEAKV